MTDRAALEAFAGAFWGAYFVFRGVHWALRKVAEWQGRRDARRALQNYVDRC